MGCYSINEWAEKYSYTIPIHSWPKQETVREIISNTHTRVITDRRGIAEGKYLYVIGYCEALKRVMTHGVNRATPGKTESIARELGIWLEVTDRKKRTKPA